MAKEFMCHFGNCEVTSAHLPILITVKHASYTEQVRFCCMRHAADWCVQEMRIDERDGVRPVRPEPSVPFSKG